jgi:hypothetical protein
LGGSVMPGVLNKIAELTDEQLAEGTSSLANARTDDLRFYHAAMLMEQDRRRGRGSKGDRPGHPFRGNQWGGGQGGQMAPDRDIGSGIAENRQPLPQEYLSQVAKVLVDKYPKPAGVIMMQNMGAGVLFSDDAGVEDVRGWLETTKFEKVSARRYELRVEKNDVLIRAEIDRSTYGVWAVLLSGTSGQQKSMKGDRPGHPFRGNQWTGGGVGGSAGSSSLGLSAALDAMTGRQPPNAATSVRKIDQSSVKSDEPLKHGGVNESRVVEIEGEGKFCFKPDAGEYPGVHPAYRGHQSVNEVAASVVDEAMGLDMVAKTEMVEIGGKKGSLQRWVNDDASVAKELIEYDGEDIKDSSKLDSAEGVSDMMYMDALIGNTDRHYGNWLVKDGKVKLIDNGMSMADNEEYGDPALRYRSLEHATTAVRGMQRMSTKFKEGLGKLLKNKSEVDAKLRESGVGATQRESFWKRAEYIQRAKMLGFGDSTLRDLGRLAEGGQLF